MKGPESTKIGLLSLRREKLVEKKNSLIRQINAKHNLDFKKKHKVNMKINRRVKEIDSISKDLYLNIKLRKLDGCWEKEVNGLL